MSRIDGSKYLLFIGYKVDKRLVEEVSARAWFLAEVDRGGKKRMPRDGYAAEAEEKFGCPPRRFRDKIWKVYAPESWRKGGAPEK